MEFHREMAARNGGARFGSPLRLREESRDAWGWTFIDRFLQDLSELGGTAGLGRGLDTAQDSMPGADPVVVLSYGFWQRHFARDHSVIGKMIRLNDRPATIVGVASNDFSGLSLRPIDLWAPIEQQPYFVARSLLLTDFSVESPGVMMWGRPRTGLMPTAVEDELASLAFVLRKQAPQDIWEKERLPSEPGAYAESLMISNRHGTGAEGRNEVYPIFGLLVTLCLQILAVACGNLGSLLLARGVARKREISIRVALGAGTRRLMRQLFTEGLLLAVLGSLAGLGLGYLVLRTLISATGLPSWLNPVPDWRVFAFAEGVSFLAAILFGLTPAWQTARQRHRSTLMRQSLIGAQVAGSCILLII
jgi:ABC-type antimicrobial peptide transport system permease subunit